MPRKRKHSGLVDWWRHVDDCRRLGRIRMKSVAGETMTNVDELG